MSALVSVSDAVRVFGATTEMIIDAAGLTLGELEHAAAEYGLIPERFLEVPILRESDLKAIAHRIS
ncbi:MAG: hypothetical protein EOP32_11935 [Rhodococcus sp. (in: high G+C Gram-positive bacteria)]|nr:MAG: hypothetical protein EOP32_11935 [Rhodococcus sp. (in: high G+C Gram-positive bacteria)]